jgi:hypothetical protein
MEQVYEKHMKIFTDRSLKEGRVGYAVITAESTITERMGQQTTIFRAKVKTQLSMLSISHCLADPKPENQMYRRAAGPNKRID